MPAMEEEEGRVMQSDTTVQEEAIRVENHSQKAENGGAGGGWMRRHGRRWLEISAYSVFVLVGQTVATILGRVYFEKGGNSKWMGTLVQVAAFPILIPFLFIKTSPAADDDDGDAASRTKSPSCLYRAANYLLFGMLVAGGSLLYSVGMEYLTVSTFTLITASQLGFNALFAFFTHAQKLTPLIINSIFLLTISSVLLFFQPLNQREIQESQSTAGKKHFIIGCICTLMGSALFGLTLTLGQIILNKFVKKCTLRDVLNFLIILSIIATCAVVIGLFASGEWRTLGAEMRGFQLGQVSYVMTLVWEALCWEMFTVGVLGLLLKVSGLFANVLIMLSVPVVPAAAVVVLHDEMNGVKVISMVLAVWGFLSFAYDEYLEETKEKDENEPSEVPLVERGNQA
ncbi:PREDICTED: probable purine permease 9 [Ipomoea nil]|uniref:probable purine permease 9 n=1 Tax=Ipomoea nil TaxID=35883 RepID=UPI000901DE87|nr:PREDICTED: probable purine permease 9 [Ipomoea nil]XP_019169803.1 PREDICTED: probable purine permease 9 [Ipomoea nil]